MFPNVVLPELLEVEDGGWSFTVAVSVTGEAEGDDLLRPESTRNKDELMSAGSSVFQRLKNAEGLRATAKDNECHNWRPRHRSRARSSDSNSVSKAEKGRGVFWTQRREAFSGQQNQTPFLKPVLLRPSLGRRVLGLLQVQSTKQKQVLLMVAQQCLCPQSSSA